ncbi:hypothetical protein ACP70R_026424 [Stipagrostis hirtigluma subsp. patula]
MSSFRKQPVTILFLAVAAIAPVLAIGISPAINTTCGALATQPKRDYCVGVLTADPAASAATDARGVATAAINLTAHKAASTLRVIADLVDELSTCRWYYIAMVESLAGVLVDFRAGRFDDAALAKAQKAMGQPDSCDILLFEGNSHKDPISQENVENDHVARLATDITYLLASKRLGQGRDW